MQIATDPAYGFGLLERLRAIPPSTVYTLAPKDYVLRGFDYYKRGRLESLHWISATKVNATVRGSADYRVTVAEDHGTLAYTCRCPAWNPAWHCKHVVCAFLTLKNLLCPSSFALPAHARDSAHLELLRTTLLGAPAAKRPKGRKAVQERLGYEVVLSLQRGVPSVHLRRDGTRVESPWNLPVELTFLATHSYYRMGFVLEQFQDFLTRYRDAYPLVLQRSGGEIPLEWDPSTPCILQTALNLVGEEVEVRGVCLHRGDLLEQGHRIWNLVVDPHSGKLLPIEDQNGWDLVDRLYNLLPTDDDGLDREVDPWLSGRWRGSRWRDGFSWAPTSLGRPPGSGGLRFRVPLPRFQDIQLPVSMNDPEEAFRGLRLEVDGHPTAYVLLDDRDAPQREYRFRIRPASGSEVPAHVIRTEWHLGSTIGSPTLPIFGFFSTLAQGQGLSPPLRAHKRKAALYEAFFQLLGSSQKAETDRVLRRCLGQGDFRTRGIKQEAAGLLHETLARYREADARLLVHEGRWVVLVNDKGRESLLYRIPYEVFGPQALRGMHRHDEIPVPQDVLPDKLATLHRRAGESGIQVLYHEKPLVSSRWEIIVDARRPGGIDWFEIHPEIRCNGTVMEEAAWRKAAETGGVIESDEAYRILDQESREVLRALDTLYRPSRPTKRRRKEMVQVPRLQILDWIALRKRGVTVRLSPEDEAVIQRLTRLEKIESSTLPKGLRATLRPYQEEGYSWLAFLYQHRFGACLADDMGLGKTIQAIALLGGILEGCIPAPVQGEGPHLVVLPPSLLFNWEQELTRFYPALRIHWYTGKERKTWFKDCDVVLTTYGLVRRDIVTLERIPFHVIVFDEAQAVKNIQADTTGAVRRLQGRFKMVMTGTPLENHLGEYYALIDLCLPGLLGDHHRFRKDVKADQSVRLDTVLYRTRPFVLRRTKDEILTDLPPKTETDFYLDLTERQKVLYQQTVAELKPSVDDAYRHKPSAQAQIIALTALLKLRQICISPRFMTGHSGDRSPKLEILVERLTNLLDAGHSALVFSQFTTCLDLVEEAIHTQGLHYLRLDGATATSRRKSIVRGFQEGTTPSVFLLSLKAGGQGLNLTRASYVFHLDPWWNPAVETQASDRAHRIGQRQHVTITRLLMRHTIEEKMMKLKQDKLALYEAVMGGGTGKRTGTGLTKDDFEFLLEEGPG